MEITANSNDILITQAKNNHTQPHLHNSAKTTTTSSATTTDTMTAPSNSLCLNNNGLDSNNYSDIKELINELLQKVVASVNQTRVSPPPSSIPLPEPAAKLNKRPQPTDKNNHHSQEERADSTLNQHDIKTQVGGEQRQQETNNMQPATTAIESVTERLHTVDGDEVEGVKDIVTLKNLELTPPPESRCKRKRISDIDEPPSASGSHSEETRHNVNRDDGQARSSGGGDGSRSADGSSTSESRSKRQRTQTKLFQAGEVKEHETGRTSRARLSTQQTPRQIKQPAKQPRQSVSKTPKQATTSTTEQIIDNQATLIDSSTPTDPQDVIFYEKNDYLAIRNEENSFYLCQLAENVRVKRPFIKVKWLDTEDEGKTYFLTSHYDKVPQRSIIMPVILNKLKSEKKSRQFFSLDEQDKSNIIERLKRSLNAPTELGES